MAGPGSRELVIPVARLAPTQSLLAIAQEITQPPGDTLGDVGAPGEVIADDRGTPANLFPDHPGMSPPEVANVLAAQRNQAVKWLNGIRYRRERCGNANADYVGCITSGETEATVTDTVTKDSHEKHTDPFRVWTGDKCSSVGYEGAAYVGRAVRQLAASEAYAVEHEFWTGTQAQAAIAAGDDYPNDQWLAQVHTITILNATDPVDPTTATALDTPQAMGALAGALGSCAGGGKGMIHIPASVLPVLQSQHLERIEADGHWYDGNDNVVVPGNGYPGTSPTGTAPPAGKVWLFATNLVTYRRTDPEVIPHTYAEALDRTTNDITWEAERYYLVDWDRCCHFAVLMTLP